MGFDDQEVSLKGKNKQAQEFRPYSLTQEYDVQAVAMTIGNAGCDRFSTSAFGDEAAACWLEARKSPLQERWTVIRHNLIGSLHPQSPEQSNLCFFDALHYCASFELMQKESGKVPRIFETALPQHYSIAAEAANVPLDRDGIPHPAAWGYILTAGDFDEKAHAVAAKTAETNLQPVAWFVEQKPQNALILAQEILPASVPAVAEVDTKESEQILATMADRQKRVQTLQYTMLAAESTRKTIRDAVEKSFGNVQKLDRDGLALCGLMGAGSIIFAVMTVASGGLLTSLAVIPVLFGGAGSIGTYIAFREAKAKSNHGRNLKWLGNNIKFVPDGEEKKLFEDFNKAARAVYALEYAACEHKKSVSRNFWRGKKALDRMIDELKLPEHMKWDLQKCYEDDNFPAPGSFLGMLDSAYATLNNAVNAKILAILKEDSARALPPAPPTPG